MKRQITASRLIVLLLLLPACEEPRQGSRVTDPEEMASAAGMSDGEGSAAGSAMNVDTDLGGATPPTMPSEECVSDQDFFAAQVW